jgi:hypothetical protein
MKVHIPIYRPILKHALETAWIHRELWPIAAVAGIAGTGAVINDVLNQAKLAASIPTSNFSEIFGSLHILGTYSSNVIFASPEQITVGTILIVAIGIGLAVIIAACQQVMLRVVHGALKRRSHLSLSEIKHEFVHPRIFRFLSLDVFLKLAIVNLMIATTILVSSLNVGQIVSDAFFGVIFSAAALSLALSLNVLVMIALIGITRNDFGIGEGLAYAWKLYRKHSFICLEMSVLLFAINFLISAAYDGTILALGVPAVMAFIAAMEVGSFPLYLALLAVTAVVVVAITLAFAGFATTFTYSAWTALVEQLNKKSITPRVTAHSKRFLQLFK